jgi:hypothetical protein
MSGNPTAQPASYSPSGKVNWARYLPALILPIATSLAMAWVLCWAFIHNWYYSIFAPMLAGFVVGGAMYLAGGIGHCRSRLVAMIAGILVGALMYLGYYHAHFVSVAGWPALERVDLLPKFIQLRMRTDTKLDRNGLPRPPNVFGNWFRFAVGFLLAAAIPAGLAYTRAGRAYCESCGRWMRRNLFTAPLGAGPILARALQTGELDSMQPVEPSAVRLLRACAMIDVEYCPGLSRPESNCLTYMTVRELNKDAPLRAQSTTFVKQHCLTPSELVILAEKLPRLRSIAVLGIEGRHANKAGRPPARSGEQMATVTPVEDNQADAAFSKRLSVIQFLLLLTPILLIIAGAGLLYLAWTQWPREGPLRAGTVLPFGLLGGIGLMSAVSGLVICGRNIDYLSHIYTHRLTSRLIRARPDFVVDPDDAEAIFVAVVPRKNWTKLNVDDPSDRGFLLLDTQRRLLLFEGLRERYHIPADALISCELEAIDVGGHLFAAVVQARVPEAAGDSNQPRPPWTGWEAPFRPRPRNLAGYRAICRGLAESLHQQICQFMSVDSKSTIREANGQ